MTSPTEGTRPWSRRTQAIGAILWCAFLAACLATLLFFAVFDPLLLIRDDTSLAWLGDRRSGYAAGFFFFWLIGIVAAGLTTWLIETRSAPDDKQPRRPHE